MKSFIRFMALATAMAAMVFIASCSTADNVAGSPSGKRPVIQKKSDTAQIYLFRGGFNGVFSTGINEMTERLRRKGIPANAMSWGSGSTAMAAIRKAHAAGSAGPIILAGHSLGATTVVTMAQQLTRSGITVDLVIVFDSLGSSPVPKGVRRFVAFKASGNKDKAGSFTPGPGFTGKIVHMDIRTLPDLENASHWNIVNQKELQDRAVREMENAYRQWRPRRRAGR